MTSQPQAANAIDAFFTGSVAETDRDLFDVLNRELKRQQDQIELIASENIVSRAVLEAQEIGRASCRERVYACV